MQRYSKLVTSCCIVVLCCIALLSLVWPTYRCFLATMINGNEGWNGFFADAAMGKMKLYPSLDKLITNNYPPLSFYVVGSIGKIIGDPILAGRLISLIAVLLIGFLIGRIIQKINGSWSAGIVGGAYFIATISLFFRGYVGMNDPQLLAQAIMVFGLFLFIQATASNQRYWVSIMVMVIAGFFKHNIITIPFAVLLWLVCKREWKTFFICCSFAACLIASGFICCYLAYGSDFFYNLMTPRTFIFRKVVDELFDLPSVALGMGVWLFIGWKHRRESYVPLISIIMLAALGVALIQRMGGGVSVNVHFDLIIAVAISIGVAFSFLKKELPCGVLLQAGFVIALMIPLLMRPTFLSFVRNFSPAHQQLIAHREQVITQKIAEVKAMSGNPICEPYLVFRAGKPFEIDLFNVEQRLASGKLLKSAITDRIKNGSLTEIKGREKICLE